MRPLMLPSRRTARTPEPLLTAPTAEAPPPSYPDHVHSPPIVDEKAVVDSDRAALLSTHDDDGGTGKPGELQPWLGLRARQALSLVSPTLLALLFIALRLLLSTGEIDEKVAGAKDKLTAACSGLEAAASIALSMPTWMADSINDSTANGIENIVHGLGTVLYLAITAIERVLIFLVDTYRSLFLCFIELLVRGSLALLMEAVQLMNTAVKAAATGIKTVISGSIEGVNDFLKTALAGINGVLSVVGQSIKTPSVAQPDLSALDNISLPSAFQDGLLQLNKTLPTLQGLRDRLDALISKPFDELKVEVNTTLNGFTFNRTLLPVPARQTATFCAEGLDLKPLDDLGQELRTLAYWGAGLLVLAAVLLGIALVCHQWYCWRSLQTHLERTREAWSSAHEDQHAFGGKQEAWNGAEPNWRPTHQADREVQPPSTSLALSNANLLSFHQLSQHPLLAVLSFRLAKRMGMRSQRSRTNLRWWLAWISHPAAVAALAIGLLGIISCQTQIVVLRSIQRPYEERLGGTFDTFGDSVLAKLNSGFVEASHDFANKTNGIILATQNELNNNFFSWVNKTTETMNSTVNELVDGIDGALNDAFKSTPLLLTPLQNFVNCINTLRNIEKALTWIHDHAHVEFPLVADDVLMLSSQRSDELVAPIKQAATGTPGNKDDGVIGALISSYVRSLERERFMFLLLVLVWALAMLIGTVIVLSHSDVGALLRRRTRRHRKQRSGITPFPKPEWPSSPRQLEVLRSPTTQQQQQQPPSSPRARLNISRPVLVDPNAAYAASISAESNFRPVADATAIANDTSSRGSLANWARKLRVPSFSQPPAPPRAEFEIQHLAPSPLGGGGAAAASPSPASWQAPAAPTFPRMSAQPSRSSTRPHVFHAI